jgi:hypothetical protein
MGMLELGRYSSNLSSARLYVDQSKRESCTVATAAVSTNLMSTRLQAITRIGVCVLTFRATPGSRAIAGTYSITFGASLGGDDNVEEEEDDDDDDNVEELSSAGLSSLACFWERANWADNRDGWSLEPKRTRAEWPSTESKL